VIEAADVWDLPTLGATMEGDHDPEEVRSSTHGSVQFWSEERVSRASSRDCGGCHREIRNGELYKRTAIPMHTHVVVVVECQGCW
jgi:hypothetical protein